MKKLLSFLVGIGIGITIGLVIVALLSPVSGTELKANWQKHLQHAKQLAQKAAQDKRTELEAELKKQPAPKAE